MKNKNYDEFVEKFKPKRTTDDCYTPPAVYSAVLDWVVNEYDIGDCTIVRPFYPCGDYEQYEYPDNCVVVDNPPFSILAQIKKFYADRGIRYFLFAPHLTLFSNSSDSLSYVVCNKTIIYENGARVRTDFVTNLEKNCFIRTAPTLRKALKNAVASTAKSLPKYRYPDTVISSAALGKIADVDFRLQRHECAFIRVLDSQRAAKKEIYGGGYLIAPAKAAELKAAELKAAKEIRCWELSEREKNIICELGNRGTNE